MYGYFFDSQIPTSFFSFSMLAVVGYLVTYAGVRFPGAEDIPSGFAALSAIPGAVWAQMIATWTSKFGLQCRGVPNALYLYK